MKTILSITPLAIEKDSRTLKMAYTFARYGYESIVIEGEESVSIDKKKLPFKLITIPFYYGEWTYSIYKRIKTHRRISTKLLELFRGISYKLVGDSLKLDSWLLPKIDLVYLHYFGQRQLAKILSIKNKNCPIIYDAHDFYPIIYSTLGEDMANITETEESRCIEQAKQMVTVCDGLVQLYENRFAMKPNVIRNCQEMRELEPITDVRKQLGLDESFFLAIVVSGSAKIGQSINESLYALADLPDHIHIVLLGKKYEQFYDTIYKLDLQHRVHLVQVVSPKQVINFIKSANISLILYYPYDVNFLNALPNGFFQSINAELPILYPNTLPEIYKICEQYELGIPIDPQDTNSIKNAILYASISPKQLQRFRENAKLATEKLSWEEEEKKLIKIIQKYV